MKLIKHPNGPRLYIATLRIHHGLTGVLLTTTGLALLIHDRHDWPFRLKDRTC